MEKNLIGLAGEFYTLAKLTHHGLVASLTLGNTKGVDILVSNPEFDQLYRVEVKTTNKEPRYMRLFGDEKFYIWPMSSKHETIAGKFLIYCFIYLSNPEQNPKFFLVPSNDVAEYVRWEHQFWRTSRNNSVQVTSMRNFRIEVSDPKGYEENWSLFKSR